MYTIRKFQEDDLTDLYKVCLYTGDSGKDASAMYSNPHILGDMYVAPYLKFAPQYCFVLEDTINNFVCGYCIGVLDSVEYYLFFTEIWRLKMKKKYFSLLSTFNELDKKIFDEIQNKSFENTEYMNQFPSHFHIDLLPQVQGKGIGRQMVESLFELFQSKGSKGVHLEASHTNYRAISFYEKLGFEKFHNTSQSVIMTKFL